MRTVIHVEIWSDVVCPWCYIGKRRFERAVEAVAADIEVRAVYRPFQLDPHAPTGMATPVSEAYAKKFGGHDRAAQIIDHVTNVAAGDGLGFRLDRAIRSNTFDAHRLLWIAEASGRQAHVKENLLRAYFVEGLDIGDHEVLARCAAESGLDHEAVAGFLHSDDGTAEVRALLASATEQGITAVPTYVIGVDGSGQQWALPGAQDSDVFERAFRRMGARSDA